MVLYIDSVLIFCILNENHISLLTLVLRLLKKHNLYVSPKKCSFFKENIKLLGLLVDKEEIRVDPAKAEVKQKWPKPENLAKLRLILGFVQFFKRFLEDLFDKGHPSTDLTRGIDRGLEFMLYTEFRRT